VAITKKEIALAEGFFERGKRISLEELLNLFEKLNLFSSRKEGEKMIPYIAGKLIRRGGSSKDSSGYFIIREVQDICGNKEYAVANYSFSRGYAGSYSRLK